VPMKWPIPVAALAAAWLAPGAHALALQPGASPGINPPPGESQPPEPTAQPPAPSAAPLPTPPLEPTELSPEGPVPPTSTREVDIDALQRELRALQARVNRAEQRLATQEARSDVAGRRAM